MFVGSRGETDEYRGYLGPTGRAPVAPIPLSAVNRIDSVAGRRGSRKRRKTYRGDSHGRTLGSLAYNASCRRQNAAKSFCQGG